MTEDSFGVIFLSNFKIISHLLEVGKNVHRTIVLHIAESLNRSIPNPQMQLRRLF